MNGAVNGESTALAPVVETATAVQSPQFFRGFDGAAVEPFPESVRKVLAEPPSPRDVEIKPDGIVFLPGVAYRRILTRAFGAGGWSILPRSPARVMGNIVVYHGALVCLGRFVAEAVGECFYRENNPNMSYASCVEGAKTDALSRCCKDLGIATDLWDANWREEWKARYAISYRGRKWDGRKQQEVETTLWRLKDRVSNPHDLMAGAGGVAPASGSEPPSSATAAAPSSPGPASTAPVAPDTGEAATDEQKAAIKAEVKRHDWKMDFARQWFGRHFGLTTQGMSADRILGKLSAQQAATVTLLLTAFGTNVYETLLAKQQELGRCR